MKTIIKIPEKEKMKDERYFVIQNCDNRGCGEFHYICVTSKASEEDIFSAASRYFTEIMQEKEVKYIPGFFIKPPEWRSSVKVVELKRDIVQLDEINERTGKDYYNSYKTKRGGLKFKIRKLFVEFAGKNRAYYMRKTYEFDKKI